MKFALALSLLLALQQPTKPTPANPFPNHEQPPRGWFCTPASSAHETQTNAHACSCLGMNADPMCGETDLDTEAQRDSSRCKVWCHKDSCSCRRLCQES